MRGKAIASVGGFGLALVIARLITFFLATANVDHSTLTPDATTIGENQLVELAVEGLTLDQAKRSATTCYPRDGVTFTPAATWDGKLVLLFSAKQAGKYLVGVYSPGASGVIAAEREILVADGKDTPDVVPSQKIWLVVVERSKARTPAIAAVEEALHQYADSCQDGRWRLLDAQTDRKGLAAGFTRMLDLFAKTSGKAQLYLVSDNGDMLYSGEIPATAEEAITLAKRYGG